MNNLREQRVHLLPGNVNVAWRDQPFTGQVHRASHPQGLSCAEIVASVPNINTREFLEQGTVCINGEVVPRELWPLVKPKSREDILVTLHMPILGGGGGGGKETLRIVATIALMAIATAITAGAAAPLLGSAFAAGTIGAQILAGAVTIGGALLLGAFVKPPAAAIEDTAQEDTGAPAALQGNQLKRGGTIPRVVGTHRIFPAFLSQPLVDLDDNYNEVIEGIYGLAGPHRIRDIKFGDVLADDIDPEQLDYQFYELSPDDDGINDNVQLMAFFDGIQDSVAFVDDSFYDRTLIAAGTIAFLDKRQGFIGGTAVYLDGGWINVANVPGFNLSTNDFTIDLWMEVDAPGVLAVVAGQRSGDTAATTSWSLAYLTNGRLEFRLSTGTGFVDTLSTATVSTGVHHVLASRSGNTVRLFIDGILQASSTFTGAVNPLGTPLHIGSRNGALPFNGWISDFRFTNGQAWHTSNFAVPTTQYKPPEPNLITRYGKTTSLRILLSEHRIAVDQPTQASRDLLSNQSVPARSTPQTQSVVARGVGFDEVWVTLTFTGGLFYSDNDFDDGWFNSLPFRVRVRSLGTQEWINLPEFHIHDRRTATFSRMLVFRWDGDTAMPGGIIDVQPPLAKGWRAAYYTVPVQDVTPSGIGGWQADSHFYDGTGETYLTQENFADSGLLNIRMQVERIDIFLNGLLPKGPIEVEIRRGQLYIADKFSYDTYELETDPPDDDLDDLGVYDFFGWATMNGDQVIILKKSNGADEVVISRVATVWNKPPITRSGEFAAIYVVATGRSLETLSAVCSGLVPDWDGAAWSGLHVTSNPAPHYRDVLVGNLNDNRIPETLVNDDVMLEWRQRCENLGFECNAVFNGEQVDRVLEIIASCGYARPRQSEVFDVAQDRDFTSVPPAQMFTPRNMRNLRWDKAFVRHRPDGLRIRYNESTDDYVERTIVVPRLGYIGAEPARLEEIRYDGITNEADATLKAIYDQQQVIDRFTFYYGEVDAEILVCRRGDLVLLQHDAVDQFAGFSRVLSFQEVDGAVVSIRLDGSVNPVASFFDDDAFFTEPMNFFSNNVGVCIRLKDGSMVSFEGELSADGFTITPVTFLSSLNLERECLVATGRLLRATRRMIIYNIRPRADLTAEVTLVDEAPQLWQYPEPIQVEDSTMRNRIINGDMSLNQRIDVFSESTDSFEFVLDRWYIYGDQGIFEATQSTDDPPSGFDYFLRAEVTAQESPVSGRHVVGQGFDASELVGFDWGRTPGRSAALSFWVRASVAGTYYGTIYSLFTGTTYCFSYSVPVANTWMQRVVIISPPPTSGTPDADTLYIQWSLGSSEGATSVINQWIVDTFANLTGNNDNGIITTLGATWDITGVQFELAPATSFEYLSDGIKLELARRYFMSVDGNTTPALLGTGVVINSTTARFLIPLDTPMVGVPELGVAAPSDLQVRVASGNIAVTAVTSIGDNPNVLGVEVTVAAGLTAGQAATLWVVSNSAFITPDWIL